MGRLSEMKVLVSKVDEPYPQVAYDYATEPRNYAKPAAIAGLGAMGVGGVMLNNARLLPARTKTRAGRERAKYVDLEAKAKAATSTGDKAYTSASRMKSIDPRRPMRMKAATKLTDAAAEARRASATQGRASDAANQAMRTVKARRRSATKAGLAVTGAGIGLTALAARNAKQRRDAGY